MLQYEKEREEVMKVHHEHLAAQYRQVLMETAEEQVEKVCCQRLGVFKLLTFDHVHAVNI